jgi:thiol-disulfide isomerase/thioredoxin
MKRLLVICLAFALQACSGKSADTPAQSIEALRGQWVLVNYWARWCKPCIEEIPELNQLDASREDVTVLGVNFDGVQGEELAQQESELGVAFTTLAKDPAADIGVPRPVVLPTTLVLNPAGEVVATLLGPQTLESLSEAIAEKQPAP